MARRPQSRGGRPFARTDRIGELIREIVAGELERIGDERLELVTVTDVKVDGSLERAVVYYSAMQAEAEGRLDAVTEGLGDVTWKIQQVINREVRARKTPQIRWEPDTVLAGALRIEEIIHSMHRDEPADGPAAGDAAAQ